MYSIHVSILQVLHNEAPLIKSQSEDGVNAAPPSEGPAGAGDHQTLEDQAGTQTEGAPDEGKTGDGKKYKWVGIDRRLYQILCHV